MLTPSDGYKFSFSRVQFILGPHATQCYGLADAPFVFS